jgi:two-component system alkaline phosphatase synthesis response regulator PhoP
MAKILLVDDTRTMIEVLKVHLMGRGHVFLVAADGLEALAVARREHPALIISDVMMPKLDGLQLCQKVRATPSIEHTPIVLISSHWTNERRLGALRSGAVACLDKPLQAAWLAKIADRLAPPTPSSRPQSHDPDANPPSVTGVKCRVPGTSTGKAGTGA